MALGGYEIFLLIVGIDVIVGPLLTLVVFNTAKRSLNFDLAVIALLQILAVAYGVSTMLEARPAYIASLGDAFHVVQATEVTDENLRKANTTLPWWGPKLVGTKYEIDKDLQSLVSDLSAIGAGKGHVPQLHVPYESVRDQVAKDAMSIADMKTRTDTKSEEIDDWLAAHSRGVASAKYQAIKIGPNYYAIVLDAKSGSMVGITSFKLNM